jgi:hypothetical protein
MKQTRQGVDEDAMLNFQPSPGVKHKDVYLRVYDATKKAMYSDQTSKFPITSAQGNKYIMVVELQSQFNLEKQKPSLKHTKISSTDGKPQEHSVQIGTFSTTKRRKS